MYRQLPTTCGQCGSALDPREADQSADGIRCWKCSARVDVDALHAALKGREAARWQRLRRGAGYGAAAFFAIAASAIAAVTLAWLVRIAWRALS